MRFVLACLALSAVGFAADRWDTFQADKVLAFSCSVESIALQLNGSSYVKEIYEARASAKRMGLPEWNLTIGEFPSTLDGRHKAEKACSKWMDEAQKRVTRK